MFELMFRNFWVNLRFFFSFPLKIDVIFTIVDTSKPPVRLSEILLCLVTIFLFCTGDKHVVLYFSKKYFLQQNIIS